MLRRVFSLMFILMLFGIGISLFVSPEVLNKSSSSVEVLRVVFNNIPAWFGAIAGIFGSTFLSYSYAIDKQKKDDLKKEHDQNIKSASQALITIASCIEQLKSIKSVYMSKIKDQACIDRSFRTINVVYGELTNASIDAASLCFLVKPRGSDANKFMASNPVFIQTAIGQYNDILALMKEKKVMGDKLTAILYETDRIESQAHSVFFEPRDFFGTKTFHDIMNFIRLSEFFFKVVQENIDTLSSIAIDLSLEIKLYVKKHGLKDRALSYENENHIFERPPTLDVDYEIKALIKRCIDREHHFNMKNWPIV